MSTIKITAKRQATLPAKFCLEMGIKPGDSLRVEKRRMENETVWVMVPQPLSLSWIGAAKKYALGKSHDMADIRKAIGRGLARAKSL